MIGFLANYRIFSKDCLKKLSTCVNLQVLQACSMPELTGFAGEFKQLKILKLRNCPKLSVFSPKIPNLVKLDVFGSLRVILSGEFPPLSKIVDPAGNKLIVSRKHGPIVLQVSSLTQSEPFKFLKDMVNRKFITVLTVDNLKQMQDEELSPLHLASELGDIGLIEFLLQQGVRPNITDKSGETPAWKIWNFRAKVTAYLTYEDAIRINSGTNIDQFVLEELIPRIKAQTPNLLNFFIKYNASIHALSAKGLTMLQQACKLGDSKCVDLLLAQGALVNKSSSKRLTALDLAVTYCDERVVQTLIDHGAIINDDKAVRD